MHIGNMDDSSSYYIKGSQLTEISYEKDLGVWISTDIKCSLKCMYTIIRQLK